MRFRWSLLFSALAVSTISMPAWAQGSAPRTEIQMLSGHAPEDAVPWDFRIESGRRAGEAARIPVPSNWQQQGFGNYQYGYDKGPRVADRGVYRRTFAVAADWKGRTIDIVFDGVMTDALVRVNGVVAGPVHQGGFNRFRHDITKLVKFGETNTIEVEVAEASAARETDIAERHGDYWVFGGIYRPVWLEMLPAESIANLAVDAEASGAWTADVLLRAPKTVTRVTAQVLDREGKPVGNAMAVAIPGGGAAKVRLAGSLERPLLWSAEAPNLYQLDVTLHAGDRAIHRVRERFGFRTFEVREGDGLYLNGQRVLLKGVNRHSFRPDTGRAIGRKEAVEDIRLIRSLNMNAVRMSHYAPEKAFLEAADELGLYVIDELSGWQHAHDTEVGRKLVRELVQRDVNHPSVLFWANGNEGGWNRELDADFGMYDPQGRTVLHPWDPFGGIDTKHYPRYPDLVRRLSGPLLVMPTEFLHGLYDGGHGAGLDDYWKAISRSPRGAGGFLWNLADEGIARTDRGGAIDTYAAYAPDGLVGPRHEKEPSFYTVRDVWSPVQIDTPQVEAGVATALNVRNAFDFTTLDAVRFRWEWLKFPTAQAGTTEPRVLARGDMRGPTVAPHGAGRLDLPASPAGRGADALRLTAVKGDETLLSWVWPTRATAVAEAPGRRVGAPIVQVQSGTVRLAVGKLHADFDAGTGLLRALSNGSRVQPLTGGPRLVLARPAANGEPAWIDAMAGTAGVYTLAAPMLASVASIDLGITDADGWNGFVLEISADGRRWTKVYDGARVARDGQTYAFPAQQVGALRITRLAGARATPRVVSVKVAGDASRFAPLNRALVQVSSGQGIDPATGRPVAWLEAPNAGGIDRVRWTLRDDGVLSMDYGYALRGPMLFHGIGFDAPLADVQRVRALVRGPQPVWQNRLRGPLLGVHDIAGKAAGLASPETAGYFADPRWTQIVSDAGALEVASDGASFLQVGARLADFPTTTVDFPNTAIGFLHAVPAMGAKGQAAELTGPAGEPATTDATYAGRLQFRF